MAWHERNTWENIEAKLKAKTIIDEKTGCWLWQGEIGKSGYGRVRVEHCKWRVHRVSAYLYLGMDRWDQNNSLALHKPKCPNKHCWNPDHLYVGNKVDNWRDKKQEMK